MDVGTVQAWPGPGSTGTGSSRPRTSRSKTSPTTSRTRPRWCGSTSANRTPTTSARSPRSSSCTGWRSRTPSPSISGPSSTPTRTHLFVTGYSVTLDSESGRLAQAEVDAFITRQALVTVRKSQGFPIDDVVERWDGSPDLAKHGTEFLLYGLLDVIVDSHFTAVEALDDEMEGLEDMLFDEKPPRREVQRRSFELRKSLVLLRRVVLPMREVVNALMRRDLGVVDEGMMPYYQDVYDHVLRATEWTESLRDLVTTILETNMTIRGNRLNSIMKKVTSWAAIIAVPTAITGFYGQNVPYPGFGHLSGFWASTIAIVVLSSVLYVVFKRRDWI